MIFRTIDSLADPVLPAYFDLYESAFPPSERIPVSDFLKAIQRRQSGHSHEANCLVALDSEGNLAAMARYDRVRKCDAAYLIYLAVSEGQRGNGFGTLTFQEIARRLHTEEPVPTALIFEVEDPANTLGPERKLAERRIEFYRRLGAKRLVGVHYIQTVAFFPEGVPMQIMVYPLREIRPEQVFQQAQTILSDAVVLTGDALEIR